MSNQPSAQSEIAATTCGKASPSGKSGAHQWESISDSCPRARVLGSLTATQCRINANRGPWQLFARGPLLTCTRDKDLSQPATRVDTTCWQFLISRHQYGPFSFFCSRNYVILHLITWLLTGWKNFLYFRRPPWGLRPVAFATSATWFILHCVHSELSHESSISAEHNSYALLHRFISPQNVVAKKRIYIKNRGPIYKISYDNLTNILR